MWFFLINDLKCTLCSFFFFYNACIIYYILVFLNIELTQGSQNTFEPQGSLRAVWGLYSEPVVLTGGWLTRVWPQYCPGPCFLVKPPLLVWFLSFTFFSQRIHKSDTQDRMMSALLPCSVNHVTLLVTCLLPITLCQHQGPLTCLHLGA